MTARNAESVGFAPAGYRVHGGAREGHRARAPEGISILDLSANVYRGGPHPHVVRAIRDAPVEVYPDPEAWTARRAIAAATDVPTERVLVGAGAAELFWTILRVEVGAGDTVVMPAHAFAEPRAAAESLGARIRFAGHTGSLRVDLAAVDAAIRAGGARAVYLCTPNNPTGDTLDAEQVAALASAHRETFFLLDEAFLDLSAAHADARVPMPGNVVRVRSLTKVHAIPGVRVGFALGSAARIARYRGARAAWTVSAMALEAIAAAMPLEGHVATVRDTMRADLHRAIECAERAGLDALPSETVFALLHVGDAATFVERCLVEHGVLLRDATSFGLPAHIRIAGVSEREAPRLEAALRGALER